MKMLNFGLIVALLSVPLHSQSPTSVPSKAVVARPAPALSSEVMLDNSKLRVLRGASEDESNVIRGRATGDTVVIPLSKLSLSVANGPAVELNVGEARFVAAKSKFEIDVPAGEPRPLVVELKGEWSARLDVCSEPKTCVRPIKVFNEEIGHSRLLFKNGFLTATHYALLKGASLTSSYYASRGTDYILFIPLSDLHVNFSGIEENLKKGQPYFSTGTEVDVSGPNDQSISWMVLRIHTAG